MSRFAQIATANGPFVLGTRVVPTPGPGQVLVRVHACGVCHSDLFVQTRASASASARAFAAQMGIRPRIETFPLERVADAFERMHSGKARFRAVLTMSDGAS